MPGGSAGRRDAFASQRVKSIAPSGAPTYGNKTMTEHIILLHGIWMRGITLHPLAHRLRSAGYAVETLDYASVYGGVEPAAARLRERMRAIGAATVHLVGHSLGALVALEAVRDAHELPPGRIVCLGPPLRGSAAARGLANVPGGRWLMGHSAHALVEGVGAWTGSRSVGVIAGSLPFGLGAVMGTLNSPHDGTVAVEETRLPGIADHRTITTSHSGLLFSSEVADLTVSFLRGGRFVSERS
jgi:pimeloyl-ACP methyl ester carboxylesterase